MEFSLSEEQKLIIDTTKKFVESELFPRRELVEKTGNLPMDLIKKSKQKQSKLVYIPLTYLKNSVEVD